MWVTDYMQAYLLKGKRYKLWEPDTYEVFREKNTIHLLPRLHNLCEFVVHHFHISVLGNNMNAGIIFEIYDIIRWLAGSLGQMTRQPSV